ncbi:3'-5' exonuclease [Bifidobacterium tibiigranuli]|nr:3'-5' exonuclease [Bifidobacterium tibiigranuli]MCI1713737.1 3'-5' exonuclease [Bifidobacterium tibiigranuli]MCI1833971.1 3'-5' exonuclease [Bifidobacterium tibiigranuli]
MPNGQHAGKKPSKAKKIVLRLLSIPFITACLLCLVIAIYALFHLGEKGAFLSLLFIIVIGAVAGFIAMVLLGSAMEPVKPKPDPDAPKDIDNEHERERAAKGRWNGLENPGQLSSQRSAQAYSHLNTVVGNEEYERLSHDNAGNTTLIPFQREETMQPDSDYIVLDLETTGFSPATCVIIDIGIVYVKNDEPVGEYAQLVDPGMPLPPEIIALTGIQDSMLVGQPRIDDIIYELHHRIGHLPILGHNIQFDIGFLNAAFQSSGLALLDNESYDTVELSCEKYPTAASHKLQDVMRRTGIDKIEEHRALADAKDTLECYKRLKAIESPQKLDAKDGIISARQNSQKTRTVFRSRYMATAKTDVRNEKPYGIVLPANGGVEIIGEEDHQEKLSEYGPGEWFWVELLRGANPKGTHRGEPTILVSLDGEQIGWTTPTNTARHYHQIPKIGGVALAHTKAGKSSKSKLDVRVEMPDAEEPSDEYKLALQNTKTLTATIIPRSADPVDKSETFGYTSDHAVFTANKMPHKKELSGPRNTLVILENNAIDALDPYQDGALLWVLLHKKIIDGTLTVQVNLGRKHLGRLNLIGTETYPAMITDNGAMTKVKIDRTGNGLTMIALMPAI